DVGYCFGTGKGTHQNEEKAFSWYLRGAENDHVLSQSTIGVRYLRGIGTPKDIMKGIYWFNLAKENGDKDAEENLALIANIII
ncbi:811_t:CDS:1, partial [Acaulospora morrowiae]